MPNNSYPTSFRLNDEDLEIIAVLKKKLGIGPTPIVRMALRRLYDAEMDLVKQASANSGGRK